MLERSLAPLLEGALFASGTFVVRSRLSLEGYAMHLGEGRLRSGSARRVWPAPLLFVLVVEQLGCSFLFVRPPREEHEAGSACVESVAAPVLDTVGSAFILTVTTIGIVSWMNEKYCPVGGGYGPCPVPELNRSFPAESLLVIGGGLLLAGSATYGYVQTGSCRRLHSGQRVKMPSKTNGPIPPNDGENGDVGFVPSPLSSLPLPPHASTSGD